jgi:uncharacterized protein (TIGR02145 family)
MTFFSCKKQTSKEVVNETGTVSDIQGNVYNTVKIGNQWWMTENLRVTVYNDSSKINEIKKDSNQEWAKTNKGAFCSLDIRYGLVYNWFAVNESKKIAPFGWHIPSDEEWKLMERTLGLSQVASDETGWRGASEKAAEKLIITASLGWPPGVTEVYGTNESGFAALPGGCRLFDGGLSDLAATGYWWSAGEKDTTKSWYRNVSSGNGGVFRYFADKNYGFSVRCVKD